MPTVSYEFQFTIHSGQVRATQPGTFSSTPQVSTGRLRSDQGQNFSETILTPSNTESANQTINVVASTQLAKVQQMLADQGAKYTFTTTVEEDKKDELTVQKTFDSDTRQPSEPPTIQKAPETQTPATAPDNNSKKPNEAVNADGSFAILTDPLEPLEVETEAVEQVEGGENPEPIAPPPPPEEVLPKQVEPAFPDETFFTSGDDVIDFNQDNNDLDGDGDIEGAIKLDQVPTDTNAADPQAIFYDALGGNDTVFLPTSDFPEVNYDLTRTFYGNEGNDIIIAGDLGFKIDGGPGNDIIVAGRGADQYSGGDGFDILSFENSFTPEGDGVDVNLSTNTVGNHGLAGTDAQGDTLLGGFEGVIGTGGIDTLIGDGNNNFFDGLGGRDRISAGGGNDGIVYRADDHIPDELNFGVDGGAGTDSFLFAAGAVAVGFLDVESIEVFDLNWATGATELTLTNLNQDSLFFSQPDQPDFFITVYIEGDALDSVIFGEDTSQWLSKGDAETILFESLDGFDQAGYTPIFSTFFEPNDGGVILYVDNEIQLTGPPSPFVTSFFTSGDDTVDFANDTMDLDGDGSAFGPIKLNFIQLDPSDPNADDIFYDMGDGNDVVFLPNSTVNGFVGFDYGRDFLAGAGDDVINIADGGLDAFGEAGNDIFAMRSAGTTATLDGGSGFDVVSYVSLTSSRVNLGTGFTENDASGNVFVSIEGLVGSSGIDELIGDANSNFLDGRAGLDELAGGGGDDFIVYEAGDHTAAFFAVNGGAGTDSLLFDGSVALTELDVSGFEIFDLDWDAIPSVLKDGLDLDVDLNLQGLPESDLLFSGDGGASITEIFIEGSAGDSVNFGNLSEWVTQEETEINLGLNPGDLDIYQETGYTPVFSLFFDVNDMEGVILHVSDSIGVFGEPTQMVP